jgi:hypothetical protein
VVVALRRFTWAFGICVASACEAVGTGTPPIELVEFAALDGNQTWTWRDDQEDVEPPLAGGLLHGRQGDSGIELRRGDRWEDAVSAGHVGLRLDPDLVLDGWAVGDAGDAATVVLARDGAADGDEAHNTDGEVCTIRRDEPVATWYATFDPVVRVTCDDGLDLVLAETFGLVWMGVDGVELDLVAPY